MESNCFMILEYIKEKVFFQNPVHLNGIDFSSYLKTMDPCRLPSLGKSDLKATLRQSAPHISFPCKSSVVFECACEQSSCSSGC